MLWYQIFQDGPEYERRRAQGTFRPADIKLKDLHDAVPKHLFERSTLRSLLYIAKHLAITYAFYFFATRIDFMSTVIVPGTSPFALITRKLLHNFLWLMYWGWQGFAFAGIWCLGHEAGHDALSPYRIVNGVVGTILHTFVGTPYFAWRATHRTHHKGTNHMDRDETYLPPTRKDFKLPDGKVAVRMDYVEMLAETPAFTIFKLVVRQFLGFQLYLLHNRKGNSKYPPWTSHYLPSSLLFKPEQRWYIIYSNIALCAMTSILGVCVHQFGWTAVVKYYLMPWLFQHNWMVMFTYLQHSDPTIPYYRGNEWTFARGALATVDRPLFGWVGRELLHNISTDHVAHHFFASIPFYNLPQVTAAIKPVLGDYYNYDSTGVLRALWRSFTQCTFVDEEDEIVFFRNQYGQTTLELDCSYKPSGTLSANVSETSARCIL
ncbi:fatty acid desaturase-domain-containing protein [Mucidula mucida]|nr:fatty acid desaturase-domain-containing protein [Mucidula mucida]